jgi:O-antigen ligase
VPLDRRDRSVPAAPIWFFGFTLALLAAVLVLGGGRGNLGDTLLQLLAVTLLLAQFRLPPLTPGPERRLLFVLPGLLVLIALLQLLPLPLAFWQTGALRTQLAQEMLAAGATVAPQLSLDPLASERALLSLLPACALFAAVWRLGPAQRRQLVLMFIALALLSILLGFAQLADGQESLLRFHSPTNTTEAVGFFANRNHFASLLVTALPFAIGAAVWWFQHRRPGAPGDILGVVGLVGIAMLLILGIALARSRAGLLLGMLAVAFCVPLLLRWRGQRGGGRALLVVIVATVLLGAQFALIGIVQRLQTDPLDDGRWEYARVLSAAAQDAGPLGTGLGTFGQVYPQYEAETGAGPGYAVVNHAHNDVLELVLELGWLAAPVLLVLLLWMGWVGWRLLRSTNGIDPQALLLARLAWVSALMLALHSFLDYPLRTTALQCVFGLMLALSVPARASTSAD